MTSCSEIPGLELAVEAQWPVAAWRDLHVVLAVSGGADSVALLRAALGVKQRAGGAGQLHVAHLNHGLRGDDATADHEWLAALCESLRLPLESARADVSALAAEQGDGWEAAARTARYDFLRTTAERLGARFVAVAHTADDQVETVLHRVFRGTGLAGLAGMPATRSLTPSVALVRPLLSVWRREVIAYLDAHGQDYRHDATNDDPRFTRNRLRHQVLPLARSEIGGDVDQAILRLAGQADQWQRAIADIVAPLVTQCVSISHAADIQIDCRALADQPLIVVGEVLKAAWSAAGWPLQDMGADQWQRLASLANEQPAPPPLTLPGDVHAKRCADAIHLTRAATDRSPA